MGQARVIAPHPAAARAASPALRFGLPIALVAIVVVCFSPVLGNGFVDWDDPYYFTSNPHYRGFTRSNLQWMFTSLYMSHYQPLSWLSHAVIYAWWGMNPAGYHLGNLVLHAANALLVYALAIAFLRLGQTREAGHDRAVHIGALVGALFFAIHPLRVEAVAWATERQEVLAAFFLLLSLLTYLRAHTGRAVHRRALYVGSVACFAFSLMSKPAGMMLPLVLLALDVYPLRRVAKVHAASSRAAVLLEKLPYVALAIGAGSLSFFAKQLHPMLTLAQHSVSARIAQSLYGLCFYLRKTLMPTQLSPLYSLQRPLSPLEGKYVVSALAVLGITAGVWLTRRRHPWALVAWVCYGVILFPVLGILQSGPQLAADRYTYLGCLPWAVVVAAGVYRLAARGRTGPPSRPTRYAAATAIAGALLALGVTAHRQTYVWRDAVSAWDQVIQVEPTVATGYNGRGLARHTRGDLDGALADYDEALRLEPRYEAAYQNRGNVRRMKGNIDGAIADYGQAIALRPSADAYSNRCAAYQARGNWEAAIADCTAALRLNPGLRNAYGSRGLARYGKGDLSGAIADYNQAIRLAAPTSQYRATFERYLATAQRQLATRPPSQ